MKKYLHIFFGFYLLVISSCNNPLNKSYSNTTYLQDVEEIRESDKTNSDDIELLTKYIALSKLAGNDLSGKTYKEILDRIKEIRKANSDQSNQVNMEKDAIRERMDPLLKVNLSEKIFSKIKNRDYFVYTIMFKNTSSKNIKMVVGSISLNDLLDREIKTIPIVLEDEIYINSIVKKTYTINYDPANENDKRIRSKNLVDLRIQWDPVKIIFMDGTVSE